jgi:hypothetical protein
MSACNQHDQGERVVDQRGGHLNGSSLAAAGAIDTGLETRRYTVDGILAVVVPAWPACLPACLPVPACGSAS